MAARRAIAIVSLEWTAVTGSGSAAIELQRMLQADGLDVVPVGWSTEVTSAGWRHSSDRRLLGRLHRLLRLVALFRRRAVHTVIVNTSVQATAILAARLSGSQTVWWCHESGMASETRVARLRKVVYRALAHKVVAVSEVSGHSTGRGYIAIPNLVQSASPSLPEPHPTGIRVVVVGKKSRVKGTDRLPKLLLPAMAAPDNVRVHVLGPEADADDKLLVEEARLSLLQAGGDRVIWDGPRSDVDSILGSADVLLLPSRSDSRPRVVEEALVRGVPVIASRLPGVEEIAARCADPDAVQYLHDNVPLVDQLRVAKSLRARRGGKPFMAPIKVSDILPTWRKVLGLAGP